MTDTPSPPPADKRATGMIWVGCKLPNGLLCELGKREEEGYQSHNLNGANGSRIVGGYGLTQVPEAFWSSWVKKNQRLEFVKKALVFAQADLASAEDHAADMAEVKSGLEPLDPLKKITDPNTGKVVLETDMDHLAEGKRQLARDGGGRRR